MTILSAGIVKFAGQLLLRILDRRHPMASQCVNKFRTSKAGDFGGLTL